MKYFILIDDLLKYDFNNQKSNYVNLSIKFNKKNLIETLK